MLQTGVALTAVAVPLWVQLSLLAECRERTELALARLDETAADAPRLRMQLSAARGWSLMYGVGRAREAGPAWIVTLQLAEQLGDSDYLLRALWGLCIDQFNNGEFRKALEFARRFSEVVAGSRNSVDLMMADRLLATTLHYLGDQNLAHHHITRTLSRLSDLTPKPQVIRFRFDLRVSAHYFQARILWLLGLADQALQVVERNIEEGQASGHALTFCSVLGQAACPLDVPCRRFRRGGALLRVADRAYRAPPYTPVELVGTGLQRHGDGPARRRCCGIACASQGT